MTGTLYEGKLTCEMRLCRCLVPLRVEWVMGRVPTTALYVRALSPSQIHPEPV